MLNERDYFYQYRVYAEDVDFMGIVYHVNYLRFYERARTEVLRENGIILTQLAIENSSFAIAELSINYLHAAKMDDLLTVSSKIVKSSFCSFIFDQKIYNEAHSLLNRATVKVVCVDKNLKPIRHKQKLILNKSQ